MTNVCPICNNEIPDNAYVCPSCGYRVMGSTQSFTPVAMGGDVLKQLSEDNQKFELRVVRGPQTGIDIELKKGDLSVGRIIKDLNSYNGVWVNDRMVETCALKSGDLLQIGAFCLLFRERP